MNLRQNEWWMVVDPDGDFIRMTASGTRRDAIHEWAVLTGVGPSDEKQAWAADRKKGYRCVKCEIREVQK